MVFFAFLRQKYSSLYFASKVPFAARGKNAYSRIFAEQAVKIFQRRTAAVSRPHFAPTSASTCVLVLSFGLRGANAYKGRQARLRLNGRHCGNHSAPREKMVARRATIFSYAGGLRPHPFFFTFLKPRKRLRGGGCSGTRKHSAARCPFCFGCF